jgi:hypothetical protein
VGVTIGEEISAGTSAAAAARVRSLKAAQNSSAERKAPLRKKRRPRNRRSGSRQRQQTELAPEVMQEPEFKYEEPTFVYIYTYTVRPAYRDYVSDYRSESSFGGSSGDHQPIQSSTMEHLLKEINAQLDEQLLAKDRPAKPIVHPFDEDEDEDDGDDYDEEYDKEDSENGFA